MNFYVCAARFLAPYVTSVGYAFLAFNRRGHDSMSTYDSREPVGGAYQTVSEGIEDNELAAQFLADQGFKNPLSSVTVTAVFWQASMLRAIRRRRP